MFVITLCTLFWLIKNKGSDFLIRPRKCPCINFFFSVRKFLGMISAGPFFRGIRARKHIGFENEGFIFNLYHFVISLQHSGTLEVHTKYVRVLQRLIAHKAAAS